MTVLTLPDLEQLGESISGILTMLPVEIRQNIDTSGKVEKYAGKRVTFGKGHVGDHVKAAHPTAPAPSLPPSNQSKAELKAKFDKKLSEVKRIPSAKTRPSGEVRKKPAKEKSVKGKPSKAADPAKAVRAETKEPQVAKPTDKDATATTTTTNLILSHLRTDRAHDKPVKKTKTTDPKQLLQKAQKTRGKLEAKRSRAEDPDQVDAQASLQSALKKARGDKLQDDPRLLRAAVKKREQRKKKSATEWGKRLKDTEKARVEKQKKRADNIAARRQKRKQKYNNKKR